MSDVTGGKSMQDYRAQIKKKSLMTESFVSEFWPFELKNLIYCVSALFVSLDYSCDI